MVNAVNAEFVKAVFHREVVWIISIDRPPETEGVPCPIGDVVMPGGDHANRLGRPSMFQGAQQRQNSAGKLNYPRHSKGMESAAVVILLQARRRAVRQGVHFSKARFPCGAGLEVPLANQLAKASTSFM